MPVPTPSHIERKLLQHVIYVSTFPSCLFVRIYLHVDRPCYTCCPRFAVAAFLAGWPDVNLARLDPELYELIQRKGPSEALSV